MAAMKADKCGEPISSCPSKKNFTFTGRLPVVLSNASTDKIGINMPPCRRKPPDPRPRHPALPVKMVVFAKGHKVLRAERRNVRR